VEPPSSLAALLTIAEAHGELWALFVRRGDGVIELHKTDTYKRYVEVGEFSAAREELEDWLKLVQADPVTCRSPVS
jgi:hypothetical protein